MIKKIVKNDPARQRGSLTEKYCTILDSVARLCDSAGS